MKILVIGGTKFFGEDIVELALDAGHQVTIFSRGNKRPDFWERVDHISGDRTDGVEFAKKLANKQFDAVIDNIAFNGEHVTIALSVFRENIGRYILTSSSSVYTSTGPFDQPVTEADATLELPVNPQAIASSSPANEWLIKYATGKIEAERALVEQVAMPYTIIRPPVSAVQQIQLVNSISNASWMVSHLYRAMAAIMPCTQYIGSTWHKAICQP